MRAADGIPTGELVAFASARRRTFVIRTAFAVAALALVGAAVLVARGLARPSVALVPAGRSGVAVIDLSGSIGQRRVQEIGRAIARVDSAEERLGLVVFSDTGYEMLPPGTPATELVPLERLFAPIPGEKTTLGQPLFPPTPWDRTFRGGTRISTGLQAGLDALDRAHVKRGALLLVSDLGDDPQDARGLATVATELDDRNIPLRILALHAAPKDRALFVQLFGSHVFVSGINAVASSGVGRRLEVSLSAPLPWGLIVVALVLFSVLASNELYCSTLSVPRSGRHA